LIELVADGPQPRQRWRIRLETGREYVLGRSVDSDLPVPWDPHISRRHARLTATANDAEVTLLPSGSNPLCYAGRRGETCRIGNGEHFVIGATKFHVVDVGTDFPSSQARPLEELTFDRQQLQKVRFRDADKRIDVLAHLPEVIWGARTETELHHCLVNLILAGVAHADAAAIVELTANDAARVLHWDRRRLAAGEFRPSSRLVAEALQNRRRSVLHVWDAREPSTGDYTAVAEFDWAFCTPVLDASASAGSLTGSAGSLTGSVGSLTASAGSLTGSTGSLTGSAGPSSAPWGLYVAGKLDRPPIQGESAGPYGTQLQADVKFTELLAEIISTVQRLNKLERQRAGYRQFFAPPILSALGDDLDTDLLEPRECDVTVLFCDLRGFSQQAEESADDLLGMLDRVSRALGVMTQQILEHGGVTGDFQGDAALGFWGWPFASSEAPLSACRAALGIRAAFATTHDQKDHPLANFTMGIGIAHGRAVAGKIGTSEQVKVTVFGPVVNLASRLESMTKQLRVPILLDERTAEIVRARLDPQQGRTRRLARILPFGMETPVLISELLPSLAEHPELTDAHVAQYELGVDHFTTGRWEEAYDCLHGMPASDRAQDFLTMLIAQHNRVAPPDWDGVVRLRNK